MELNYDLKDNDGYILSSCILTDEKEFLLPTSYKGKPIIGIGKKCFKNCKTLKKVVLTSNVNHIEKDAFFNCPLFEELDVYKTTCPVHKLMFNKCPNFKKIFIVDSFNRHNFYQFLIHGVSYVKFCFKGEKINVDMVAGIKSLFSLMKNLESEYDENFAIGNKEIKDNDGLLYFLDKNDNAIIAGLSDVDDNNYDNIIIPEIIDGHEVKGIADFAFYQSSFKAMIIPETVNHIGYFAFGCCAFDYIKIPRKYSGFRKDIFCEISLEDIIYLPRQFDKFFIVELPDNINADVYNSIEDNLSPRYKFICINKHYSNFQICDDSSFVYDQDNEIAYIKNETDIQILYMKIFDKKINIPNVIDSKPVKYINASLCEYLLEVLQRDQDLFDDNVNSIVTPKILPIHIEQDFILKDDFNHKFWVFDNKIYNDYHGVVYDKKVKDFISEKFKESYSGFYLLEKGSPETKKIKTNERGKCLLYEGNEIKSGNITYLKINSNDYLNELHISNDGDEKIEEQFRYYIDKLAYIIKIEPVDNIIVIPDEVDGIPVIGCAINLEESKPNLSIVLNEFIRDHEMNLCFFNSGVNYNINIFIKYDKKSTIGFMQFCENIGYRINKPHAFCFYNENDDVYSLIKDFLKDDFGKDERNITYVYLPKKLRGLVRYGCSSINYFKDMKIICSNKIEFKPKLPKSAKLDFYN